MYITAYMLSSALTGTGNGSFESLYSNFRNTWK